MNSRDQVDRVRNALDTLEMIREAVPSLRQNGARWRGLCPFHNERTPSFYVMPDKGLWHCFGACQEGGDIFKFVMRRENLTFPEALRQLAEKAGIKLEADRGGLASRESQEREAIFEILAEAAAFYNETLRKSADAEPARRYLAQRQIKSETVEKFQIGYAPLRNGFLDLALRKAVPIEILTKAGLAARSEKTGRYNDPQWGRLVFPILDAYGHAVGFGGRVLEDKPGVPKYVNSHEGPVYTKGRNLYGLFQGRTGLRGRGRAVVVEGYMDVIGCHQAGADFAVAPLGTAFTKEQAQLLKRYVQEVVLLFDPDEAGYRASGRSAEVLLKEDIFVRVARLPGEQDPDEFILAHGVDAFEKVLAGAQDVVDFWLDRATAGATGPQDLQQRARLAQELIVLLKGVPNEILREEWLRKVAQRLSVSEASMAREFKKQAPGAAAAAAAAPPPRPAARTAPPSASSRRGERVPSVEEEILQLLCSYPEAWPPQPIAKELFGLPRCSLVYEKLLAQRQAGGRVNLASLVGELTPLDSAWLSGLLLEEKRFEKPSEELAARLRGLHEMASQRERKQLETEMMEMLQGRVPRDEAKLARYKELTRILKGS